MPECCQKVLPVAILLHQFLGLAGKNLFACLEFCCSFVQRLIKLRHSLLLAPAFNQVGRLAGDHFAHVLFPLGKFFGIAKMNRKHPDQFILPVDDGCRLYGAVARFGGSLQVGFVTCVCRHI